MSAIPRRNQIFFVGLAILGVHLVTLPGWVQENKTVEAGHLQPTQQAQTDETQAATGQSREDSHEKELLHPEEIRQRRFFRSKTTVYRVLEVPKYVLEVPWYPVEMLLNFSEEHEPGRKRF